MAIDCPVAGCEGRVHTKRLELHGIVMFCDAEDSHGDTMIRFAFDRIDSELEAIDPENEDALLLRVDPVEYIRDQVYKSREKRSGGIAPPSKAKLVPPPKYPTGLLGVQGPKLLHCRGMTCYSGFPSAGKSWAGIRASLDAARQGWDVNYLACEGIAVTNARANEMDAALFAAAGARTERWSLNDISQDTTVDQLIEWIGSRIRSERTLLVIDSFSTLLDALDLGTSGEWDSVRALERMLFNLRQDTAGCIGILVLAEANASGETRGRRFDHIADLSVNFKSDDEEPSKKIVTVKKAWWDQTGEVGNFVVSPERGGLVRIPDYEAANAGKNRYTVGGE